jgi:hypothetical protein
MNLSQMLYYNKHGLCLTQNPFLIMCSLKPAHTTFEHKQYIPTCPWSLGYTPLPSTAPTCIVNITKYTTFMPMLIYCWHLNVVAIKLCKFLAQKLVTARLKNQPNVVTANLFADGRNYRLNGGKSCQAFIFQTFFLTRFFCVKEQTRCLNRRSLT